MHVCVVPPLPSPASPVLSTAKDLDEGSYASWAHRYKAACASSTNRASKVAAMCEELEAGLTLLGATAVEDKLQVCVSRSAYGGADGRGKPPGVVEACHRHNPQSTGLAGLQVPIQERAKRGRVAIGATARETQHFAPFALSVCLLIHRRVCRSRLLRCQLLASRCGC